MIDKPTKQRSPISWIPSVYFAMGMPNVVLSLMSVIMLVDMGIDEAKITFWASLLVLPYSLKPLWSPVLEMYGSKRRFVVATQFISGICFTLIAFCLPLPFYFSFTIALMAIIGFSGATHDIATDGIYLTTLSKKVQAKYIGWQGAFFNLAKVMANGGLVWLAGKLRRHFQASNPEKATVYAWMIVMAILGVVLIFLSVYHFFVLPKGTSVTDNPKSFAQSMASFATVFKEFFTKKHIIIYICFIVCYRLTEGFAIRMLPIFLKDARDVGGLGLDNEYVGLVYGTLGTLAFILGSILGGYYIAHFGLKKVLFSLVCIFNVPFVVYFLFACYQPENLVLVAAGLVGEYFCYGFGFVGLTLFMMQQVATGSHAMAHYAFASGIMNLGFMLPGMISGWLYQQVGFQWFFAIALLLAVPVFVLTKKVPFVAVDKGDE